MPTDEDHVDRIRQQWQTERPDLDTSPIAVIGRLHRVADALRAELIALYRTYGLGEGEFDVLATLRRQGEPYEIAPGHLAEHTMVTTGAVSKRVDRLEAAGLVTRRADSADARGRVVALTDAGRTLIDEAFTAHVQNEAGLVSHLPEQDRAVLERVLREWGLALGL